MSTSLWIQSNGSEYRRKPVERRNSAALHVGPRLALWWISRSMLLTCNFLGIHTNTVTGPQKEYDAPRT